METGRLPIGADVWYPAAMRRHKPLLNASIASHFVASGELSGDGQGTHPGTLRNVTEPHDASFELSFERAGAWREIGFWVRSLASAVIPGVGDEDYVGGEWVVRKVDSVSRHEVFRSRDRYAAETRMKKLAAGDGADEFRT